MFRFITLKAWLLSKSCEMFFNVCQLSSVTQRLLFTSRRGSGHHDPMYLSNIGSSRLFHRVSVATSNSVTTDMLQQDLAFESRQLSTLSWLEMFGRASSSVKRRTWFESLWSFVSFILLENKKNWSGFHDRDAPMRSENVFQATHLTRSLRSDLVLHWRHLFQKNQGKKFRRRFRENVRTTKKLSRVVFFQSHDRRGRADVPADVILASSSSRPFRRLRPSTVFWSDWLTQQQRCFFCLDLCKVTVLEAGPIQTKTKWKLR